MRSVLEASSHPKMSVQTSVQGSEQIRYGESRSQDSQTRLQAEGRPKDADIAYDFLNSIHLAQEETSSINLDKLRRKIDLRLVPYLLLCYAMCWLDKAILNYANVMGLREDLGLKGNDFSNANTFFYTAMTLAEIPTGFILNKVSVRKWLGYNVILWGVTTACVAASNDYHSLLATRVLVGTFEAAVAPCLLLVVGSWYTKSEQSQRFVWWYAGLGCGQIVGGLESFGFQHVHHDVIQSWRIMFITMGLVTVVLGVLTLSFLAENPLQADYLTKAEKVAVLRHISVNRTGVSNLHFVASQVVELMLDVQIWWLMAVVISVAITSGIISSYSTTILANFGFSSERAALLNSLSGLISICSAIICGLGVRKTGHRWLWILVALIPSITGAALMSFVPGSDRAAILAGVYLVNTCTATLPLIYGWTAANIAGHTKRPVAMGMISAAFGIANLIGPQTFRAKDAPLYRPALLTSLSTLSVGAVLTIGLALYYVRQNEMRNEQHCVEQGDGVEETWGNLTDRENAAFRYVV